MTEYIPVERILGPTREIDANSQATSTSEAVTLPNRNPEQITEEFSNSPEMARISWLRCKGNWFVFDGLGITCAGITYGLILYAEFVVIGVILSTDFPSSPWAYLHSLLFTCLALLAVSAHARSMTSDPVSIPHFQYIRVVLIKFTSMAGPTRQGCGGVTDTPRNFRRYPGSAPPQ